MRIIPIVLGIIGIVLIALDIRDLLPFEKVGEFEPLHVGIALLGIAIFGRFLAVWLFLGGVIYAGLNIFIPHWGYSGFIGGGVLILVSLVLFAVGGTGGGTKYYCVDCGNVLDGPVRCDRCGCNQYTTKNTLED